jgi:DNA-binding XRE family transcriptional regulator
VLRHARDHPPGNELEVALRRSWKRRQQMRLPRSMIAMRDPARLAAWEQRRREVGQRIRDLRIERGLSQEQLALRSGVTRNVLIDVEHGRRGLLYERLYAEALEVSAGRLLND